MRTPAAVRSRGLWGVLAAAALAAPLPLGAQADSVTVAAGAHYRAGGLKATVLGRHYRDLWTTPIRVPVLDLGAFAGGLAPVRRGSGQQTVSLRFLAHDGREYNFRSVDKDQSGGMHPDFHGTLIDQIAQDQVSSKHPASALISDPILRAAGVLHPEPRLYVMPDDPRLGEFRAEFAGMLGMIEVHPDEGEDERALFEGAIRVTDTEGVLENLAESPEHRVDGRAFLRARLADFFLGDWDRHPGQWRWARYDREGARWWLPVPEDRDNAFSFYDGLMMDVVRRVTPNLVEFRATYPDVYALSVNGQELDRRLLSELSRESFDSVAAELRARFTDEVLEGAVAQAPPEYHALRGAELLGKLRARREGIPDVARAFYAQLALEAEVHATDEPETATVDRHPDGSVEVRLFAGAQDPAPEPYFRRRFLPGETREVRVYLEGGDDRAFVRGEADASLLVRVIGGAGNDFLADSSRVPGRPRTAFYDDRGDTVLSVGPGTMFDPRRFAGPDTVALGFNDNRPPLRDWGRERAWFQPWAEWRYNVGPVIGGGPEIVRYGFRRYPYAHRLRARALYAPLETRFGLEVSGERRLTNSFSRTSFEARASQLEVTRFHGFGNDTPGGGDAERFKVPATEYRLQALFHKGMGPRAEVFLGPVLRYTRPEVEPGSPASAPGVVGAEPFGQIGATAGAAVDTRDLPTFPRRGVLTRFDASFFPATVELPSAFGALEAGAATYLPLPLPLESTLALRAGGRRVWGEFPLQEAAFLGGSGTLRGFPRQRYAGDVSVFGGAEVRTFLTRFNFISRGDLGVIALADAGRVFVEGRSDDGGLHLGYGGGVWIGILDRTRTASIVVAGGEETAVYLSLGMPF